VASFFCRFLRKIYLHANSPTTAIFCFFTVIQYSFLPKLIILRTPSANCVAGLEGTWFMPTDRGDRLEIWWKEDDQTLAGKNVRIKPENGDTVLLERLRIELRDTTITYIAIARGQNSNKPVSFLLTEIDEEGFFVFSNPEHDDPQTIRYLLLGNREMQVETIGKRNGREVKQEFVFEREFTPGAVEFRVRGGINASNLRGIRQPDTA
jgi:hypothetical protein